MSPDYLLALLPVIFLALLCCVLYRKHKAKLAEEQYIPPADNEDMVEFAAKVIR